MAGFDKQKIFEKSRELIAEHGLYFVEDIVAYLPCSKATFYIFFPFDSDELDTLKELLEVNRVSTKVSMRKKWKDADAPALQLALMKLISTPEELKKLSMQHTEGEIKQDVTISFK